MSKRIEGDRMKVYIDSCSQEALSLAEKMGIGITTNPSIILKENCGSLPDLIQYLKKLNVSTIFFQIEELDEEILEHLDPRKFVIKIPWIAQKYNFCVPLKKRGFRICATAVYEISQLIFALSFDIDYVAFYYDRAKKRAIDPHERIALLKQVIKNSNEATKLIVASLKTTEQAVDAIMAGGDEIAIPLEVFREFIKVPEYVEQDIKRFSEDFSKLLSLSSSHHRRTL